jgi:RNA polymerase sigma factor (sigma-70 family)
VVISNSDDEVYRKYADELIGFATFLVGPSEAPDVMSEAVVKVLTSRGWIGVTNQRAYLFRAVLNEARMAHRGQRRRRGYEQRGAARDEVHEPTAPRPEVVAAIRRLSPRQRAVIFLTYWDDLDPRGAAALLGISEGAVRRHLARARKALRRTLHDD